MPDTAESCATKPAARHPGLRLAVLIVGSERGLQPIKHRAFLDALRAHFPNLQVWDVELGWVRGAIDLLRSFNPNIQRWRGRYNAHPAVFRARGRAFARLCLARGDEVDAFLQIGATFDSAAQAQGRPVVIYTDFATVLTARLGRFYRLNLPGDLAQERIAQEAAALAGAAHVCSRSRYVADAMTAAYKLPETRVSVVGAGPNLQGTTSQHISEAPPRLLFIGREFLRKGGDVVLDAFRRLQAVHPQACIDIVAPVAEHRAVAGIVWHSKVGEAELLALYAQAQIFVLASRFETWGDVLIEAMTAGIACIVPDKPPLDEIIHDGADGLTYTPGDPTALAEAMARLFCDAALRARLGAAARARARREFSWPVVTDKIAHRIALAVANHEAAGPGARAEVAARNSAVTAPQLFSDAAEQSAARALQPARPFAVQVIDNLSIGGAQRLLVMLANHLQGQGGVTIVNIDGTPSFFADWITSAGAELIGVGARRIGRPWDWYKMWRTFRALRADIVHLHLTNATIFGSVIARMQRKRVVVTLHNVRTVEAAKPLARLKYRLESLCLRRFADHIIFVGENVRIANAARLHTVPQTVLPNVMPAPLPVAEGTRQRLRAGLGRDEAEIVLLSSGRFSPQKDHRNLLAAFREVAAARSDVHLWIAGDGALRAELQAEAERAGLAERISFLGARPDIADLLAAADVFVLSSQWEGLPLGLLEAMAQGLPSVATMVGDVPEVLSQGGGELVAPQDPAALAQAVLSLCDSSARRHALGAEALVAVRPYIDVDGWIAQTRSIYASLAQR